MSNQMDDISRNNYFQIIIFSRLCNVFFSTYILKYVEKRGSDERARGYLLAGFLLHADVRYSTKWIVPPLHSLVSSDSSQLFEAEEVMFRFLVKLTLLVTMLSSAARAFSSTSRFGHSFLRKSKTCNTHPLVTRFMSTTDGEASIVDTCKEKLMKALETDDVTVTGW